MPTFAASAGSSFCSEAEGEGVEVEVVDRRVAERTGAHGHLMFASSLTVSTILLQPKLVQAEEVA